MNPSIPEQIARNRRYIRARSKPRIGILGTSDGTLFHPDKGYYWARWRGSKDANGFAGTGQPFPVWAGETNYLPQANRQVYIGTGLNGRLTILGAVPDDLVNAGFDARAHNPNDAYRQYVYTPNIVTFRSDALADEGNDTLKVNLNQLLYEDAYGDFNLWNGTDETTHLDMATFEALLAVDQHCYGVVALKTLENEPQTAASTPKSLFDPLTLADAQEAKAKLDPECIKSRVYRIFYDMGTLVADPVTDWDLRQWINVPARLGNPTVITERLRVRANHQMLYYGEVQVLGELQVLGETLLLGAGGGSGGSSGITELTGDVTAGPGSGSQVATLANTAVAPGSYTNTALTVDSKGRITNASSGASPVIDFDVAADSGTPATIEDGDTVTLAGGTGITSVISGNTVTHNLDNTAVTPAQYINPYAMTVDQQGRITEVFEGAPLSPDYISPGAFAMRKIDNQTIDFGVGYCEVDSLTVRKTEITRVDVASASWEIGSETASQVIWFYINAGGFIVPFAAGPNAPDPATAETPKATMLVNQSGWNGTAASGLNATSVVYDNDTGEGNVTPGDIVIVYASSDSDYSVSRGRGSGAAGSSNFVSTALITAIDTGTNTLTLEAGHNIAINDNDRLLVVPRGALIYRWHSGTTYRFIGSMYNNASSNLDDNRIAYSARYLTNEGSNATTTSTTFADVASYFNLPILTTGGDVEFCLSGAISHSGVNGGIYFDMLVDGIQQYGDDGGTFSIAVDAAVAFPLDFKRIIRNLLPGTHEFKPQWKRVNTGTASFYAGAGTATRDAHGEFMVREVGHRE